MAPALIALLAWAGCGGGGEAPTSVAGAETSAPQVQASPEAREQNEKVREELGEGQKDEALTPEEREVEQTATDFYAVLGSDEAVKDPNRTMIDSASFCELMSDEAQAQTIHYAKVSSGAAKQWDCEAAVELLVIRSKRTGGFNGAQDAEVIGVNAEGDRGTATIRFGGGAVTSISLVREEGEWKLAPSSAPGAP